MTENILFSISEYNFNLLQNELLGICGITGSGKTTLLNKIYEHLHSKMDISYCFQESRLLENLSVEKNLSLVSSNVEQWIDLLDLNDVRNKKCGKISGGEAQRVNLARAFAWNGQLFLLDEPFSSQDQNHTETIEQLIKKVNLTGRTIVLVSHNKEILQRLCHRVIELPFEVNLKG